MCFEVPALNPPGGVPNENKSTSNVDDAGDDDLGIMDIDDNDSKAGLSQLFAPNVYYSIMHLAYAGAYT